MRRLWRTAGQLVRLQSNLRKMGFLKVSQPGISEPSFQHVQSDMPSNLLSVKSCFPTPLFHRLYSVVQVCAPAFGRFMQEKVFHSPPWTIYYISLPDCREKSRGNYKISICCFCQLHAFSSCTCSNSITNQPSSLGKNCINSMMRLFWAVSMMVCISAKIFSDFP